MIQSPDVSFLRRMIRDALVATVGCTDPSAIALSAAHAGSAVFDAYAPREDAQTMLDLIARIDVRIDPKLFKNAQYARIPNTQGLYGVDLAILLGLLIGSTDFGLQLFQLVRPNLLACAGRQENRALVHIRMAEPEIGLYCETRITLQDGKSGAACIRGHHNTIAWVEEDGKRTVHNHACSGFPNQLPVREDYPADTERLSMGTLEELAMQVMALSDVDLPEIHAAFAMNRKVWMDGEVGSGATYGLSRFPDSNNLVTIPLISRQAVALATYRRMAGEPVEVMACGGSGNHGLTFFLTVMHGWALPGIVAERSLFHGAAFGVALIAIMKERTGIITSLCGCSLTSALAASAALAWGMGGAERDMLRAMNIVLLSLGGIVCDGAKPACAYKTGLGSQVAIEAACMARQASGMDSGEGLGFRSFTGLLHVLEELHTHGMTSFEHTMGTLLMEKVHAGSPQGIGSTP
ncbi:MAG: hypothetical protein A2Y31_00155 [Spirochaetes bacterium GWC2_52_13]|nr:MAG: hypothetical protein A2Y31_00155 [Spirochaetes bacterium GWC2_52_13]